MAPLMDVVLIPLLAGDGSLKGHAIVDAADAAFANRWIWRLHKTGYATRGEKRAGVRRTIKLHRELLGLPRVSDERVGDHIDRDRLNNRRSNLRIVTRAQNLQNTSSAKGSSSQFRGVYWKSDRQRWAAKVSAGGKYHHLGYFTEEQAAAQAARDGRARLLPYAADL